MRWKTENSFFSPKLPVALTSSSWGNINTGVIEENAIHRLARTFLLVKELKDMNILVGSGELNVYVLSIQKILTEKKMIPDIDLIVLNMHMDVFLGLLFETLHSQPEYTQNFKTKTKDEFIRFMRDEVFVWKPLWEDIDLAEIIAGNTSYCTNINTFPTVTDQNWCKAQMTFYRAKSLADCDTISSKEFPNWRKICDDYYKLVP